MNRHSPHGGHGTEPGTSYSSTAASVTASLAGAGTDAYSTRTVAALAAAIAVPPSRTEQVDVAIVGAGVCGLACAVALHKVYPECTVKVFERRPQPADLSEGTPGVGGGVHLEANGIKALTAISRRLAAGVMSNGLYAQRVLLHDTQAGALITHLHEHPHLFHPSARQPALVVGWSELQQLLLDQLPPDTVHWEAAATSYVDNPSTAGVTLHLLTRKQQPEQQQQEEDQDNGEGGSRQQQGWGRASPAVSPFHAAAQQDRPYSSGSGIATARDAAAAAAAAAAAGATEQAPAGPRQQQQQQDQGQHRLQQQEAQPEDDDVEHVVVQARLVIAADGAMSLVRQQLVGDGPPSFDGTMRWVGRLPGDLLSTIPVEYEAWWLGQGKAFNSHPLSCGDVVWEAQVSSSSLEAVGLRWDQQTHTLTPMQTQQTGAGAEPQQQQQQQEAAMGNGTALSAGEQHSDTSGRAGGSFGTVSDSVGRVAAAAVAAAPAGEMEAGQAETVQLAAAKAEKTAADVVADTNGFDRAGSSSQSPESPSQAVLLQRLFSDFPAPVLDMIAATPPSAFLEAAVLTRPARSMPTSLGRGGVAVLGEAAHPLRPTGQDVSQAFEDAAELGACVMACGVSREALRRLELRRRPRWRHIMQVSQALGSCSNLGGISLHQGLLDYTAQLYQVSFVPLRTMQPSKPPVRRRLLRWLGYGLLAWGTAAGLNALAHRDSARDGTAGRAGEGPVGKVIAGVAASVEEAGEAAGKMLEGVTKSAAHMPGSLLKAAHIGAKGATKAEHGLGTAVATVAEVAEETAGAVAGPVVHGQVGRDGSGSGAGRRFRDAIVGRAIGVGAVVGKPFGKFMQHKMVHEFAKQLGAF